MVEEILRKGIQRYIPKGTMLYFEGDECTHIGFIVRGEIRVYKTGNSGREITLYEIGPGDTCILNASCILSKMPYPAEAKSSSDCQLLLLSAEHFSILMGACEEMRTYIFALLSQRLTAVISLIEEVVFGKMDKRLMDYLIAKSENDLLHATHQSIANDLGTSREVVSRLLKDFERKGKILLSRSTVRLLSS